MSFTKSATATGSAYAIDGTITGNLVTSSATATVSSEISESDAYNSAYSIASTVAQSVANNNANIIDQAVSIVQSYSPVTFGVNAGYTGQGIHSIAIGDNAGYAGQSSYSVAIGYKAGEYNQGDNSVAIGDSAGFTGQFSYSVAVGSGSGNNNQGNYSVAIGSNAGNNNQGSYSIAIGNEAGRTGQSDNSIVLNAMSVALNTESSGFYVKPINLSNTSTKALVYNTDTGEINYATSGTKTFVIDHPVNPEKYLVHACLEGPEAGVYYRGEGTICNNHSIEINLPDYVDKLVNDFTVQVTPIYDPSITKPLLTSRVVNNKFTVYGENCDFFWTVHGKRGSIEVEPTKSDVYIKGSGPYLWI